MIYIIIEKEQYYFNIIKKKLLKEYTIQNIDHILTSFYVDSYKDIQNGQVF